MTPSEHASGERAEPLPRSELSRLRAWAMGGRANMATVAGVLVATLVLLASFIPAGGGVSRSHLQAVIGASYHTTGSHCVGASHGRDLCTIAAGRCTGRILVAPVSSGSFTIVTATPDTLDSAECDQGESVAGEAE